MTDADKSILSPPDLSELMSQIIIDGNIGERLVFVEYDPATRAFYDHIGLPANDHSLEDTLKTAKNSSNSWGEFLTTLCCAVNMPDWLKSIFPQRLARTAELLLLHCFDLLPDAIDVRTLNIHERFLVCIARSNKKKDEKEDADCLKKLTPGDLHKLFHWLIQRVPQSEDTGDSSKLKCSGWEKVNNEPTKIKEFPEVAGLEFLFGIRTCEGNYHARLNVHLETGECVGQMIVFSGEQYPSTPAQLMNRAVEAVALVRRALPEVRQARYVDKILSGGEGCDLEHILIRHLPMLIPLKEFYVRTIDHNAEDEIIGTWQDFFSEEARITVHKAAPPEADDRVFCHFKENPRDIGTPIDDHIKAAPANVTSPWEDGFIDWDKKKDDREVVIAFSTLTFGRREGGVAVIAVTDKKYFSGRLFNLTKQQTFDGVRDHRWYYRKSENSNKNPRNLPRSLFLRTRHFLDDESWQRFLRTQLRTTLAVVLEPGRPLRDRLVHARKDGKTYREQYGTTIYKQNYLDVEGSDAFWGKSDDFRVVSKIIKYTQAKLTDTLYEPRGYRAIARIIFDRFFCQLWRYFGFRGDPAKTKVDAGTDSHTSLGSLVREALDFEDTLRLEGGYREHFIHSYHVFLIGLVLMKKLPNLLKKDHLTNDDLKIWFITAMYHDIAYPIEKMATISSKYLQRLDPGASGWPGVGDRLRVELLVGYGALISGSLLGTRLKALTSAFVQELFDTKDTRHEALVEWLKILPIKLDMEAYKKGVQESFFQHCLRIVLNDGEHGILGALLLQNAARRSQDWASLREACEIASVAIFAHHSLEDVGKTTDEIKKKSKWGVHGRWCVVGVKKHLKGLDKLSETEIAEAIGFAPTLFSYDLGSDNPYRFFTSMLILCDTLSQWGRSKDIIKEGRINLRNQVEGDELRVALCYPDKAEKHMDGIIKEYYQSQLEAITFSPEQWLLGLSFGPCAVDDDRSIPPEKCDKCSAKKIKFPSKLDGKVTPPMDTVMERFAQEFEKRLEDEASEEKDLLGL